MTQEKIKPYEGIDLVHMIQHLMKAWWKMLIAMVVLGVAFGGYSYYKNAQAIEAKEQAAALKATQESAEETDTMPSSVEEILENAGLNKKTADEVLYYTNKYFYYQKQYNRHLEYMENSVLMQMDPNQVWTATLYYDLSVLGASSEVVTDSMLATTYLAQLENETVYQKMAETLDMDIDSEYFAELIVGNKVDNYTNGDMITDKEELKIVIRYKDQAGCEAITQIVEEQMSASKQEVSKVAGNHQVQLVGKSIACKADVPLLNDQRNQINALVNLSDNAVAARNNIEASEEGVFNALLEYYAHREDTVQVVDQEEKEESVTMPETRTEKAKPGISKKYVAFGMLLGIFFVAAFEGFKYFFSRKLKQMSELENGYGLTVYDSCDQAIIRLVMQDKHVFRVSSSADIAADEEALAKLMDAEWVMLEEKINVSSHDDIAKLLEICKKLEKKVLGAIVEA